MLEMPINYFIFQALTDFSVVINLDKRYCVVNAFSGIGFFPFFVRFWDYRLSIQFILNRLIKRKFQFICLTMFMFTYEVNCYSLQKKTKRWRL